MDILDRITMLLGNREQKELTNYLKLNNVAFSEWKSGKSKSYRKYLIELAEFFNVSIDYLVYGREKNSSTDKLSDDEQELITYYRQLDPKSQGILLGRAETMAENRQSVTDDPPKNAPCVTTSLVYSRSTDNMPPRTVTGDFSDILNAPDATDEY
ncbi:MAG: helix-turn-helix domain-containing protein [Ruminococcus sp.]|nr:helix-turn-helix domain-containing protein [Ruminococcus sp.]